MLKQRKLLVPVIIIYVILAAILIVTAVSPSFDLSVSEFLTGGRIMPASASYSIANTLEIWAEPVTLLPMCFILAMAVICCARVKRGKIYTVTGLVLAAGGAVLSDQVVYRIVKYYCKLGDITAPWVYSEGPFASSKLWVKGVCAVAGVAMFAFFLFIASKIKGDIYKITGKVIALCVISLIAELVIISGIKLVWGRMRFREYIQTGEGFTAWYLPQFRVIHDGYKSFPSGHTANALLILPITFFFDALGKRKAGVAARICHLVWMLVIMTSRIMAGAHYLSDVTAGALITFTIVIIVAEIIFRPKKQA